MLRQARQLSTLAVTAWDGAVGEIEDFYFDDLAWTVRYLVVRTKEWLDGRRVLLIPGAIKEIKWSEASILLDLSREQVGNSPPVEAEAPLSRQYEIDLHNYYNWPYYWSNIGPLGVGGPTLDQPVPAATAALAYAVDEEAENRHLRSMEEVVGYEVAASDGNAGTVKDFVINTENWAIFYMLIDTSNWLQAERQVLLAPTWVEKIEWTTERFTVDVTRALLKQSPQFDPADLIEREYEKRLFEHFGRRGYWLADDAKDIPEDVS